MPKIDEARSVVRVVDPARGDTAQIGYELSQSSIEADQLRTLMDAEHIQLPPVRRGRGSGKAHWTDRELKGPIGPLRQHPEVAPSLRCSASERRRITPADGVEDKGAPIRHPRPAALIVHVPPAGNHRTGIRTVHADFPQLAPGGVGRIADFETQQPPVVRPPWAIDTAGDSRQPP